MAGSNDDATSSGTLESADKLTDVVKMREALEKLCHDEVCKVKYIFTEIALSYFTVTLTKVRHEKNFLQFNNSLNKQKQIISMRN